MKNEHFKSSKVFITLMALACVMTAFAKPAVEPPKLKGARMPQVVAPEHATRTWPIRPLADSGQKTDTTSVFGEDSDYVRNPQSYKDNGDGTVTDNVTGLMWTKADGGENTWEAYVTYCDQLTLAGHSDWRLPDAEEAYTLIDISASPFNAVFTANRDAKYFWTMNRQADGDDKRWEVNQGGGTGAHLKNLTISAGGNRSFHGRCVREPSPSKRVKEHFTDNKDGTVTDNGNGLVWMQTEAGEMTWENAIKYCENLLLAGKDDWRLPDIKELKSISDYTLYSPAIDMGYFPGLKVTYHWSSSATRQEKPRWYLNFESGLTAYTENLDDPLDVKCVRAGTTISK
jgi:hypothetical protein